MEWPSIKAEKFPPFQCFQTIHEKGYLNTLPRNAIYMDLFLPAKVPCTKVRRKLQFYHFWLEAWVQLILKAAHCKTIYGFREKSVLHIVALVVTMRYCNFSVPEICFRALYFTSMHNFHSTAFLQTHISPVPHLILSLLLQISINLWNST